MNKITLFTDGSSRGNPGPGGWGAIVITPGTSKDAGPERSTITELGGGEKHTTNNQMEIMAAVKGLEHTPKGSSVIVHTDSSYVINGITKWIAGWKRNGWQTKDKRDVLNAGLWKALDILKQDRNTEWKYVGGHVGILGNERCDHIATSFADGNKIHLYEGPLAAYDLPGILTISLDAEKHVKKSSDSARSRMKAYSYVSMVGGIIETHRSWAECEKRVKGARGARFKKAVSAAEEGEIMKEFGSF